MVYTITVNPALDYHVYNELRKGKIQTKNILLLAGGKGINVSKVLHEVGVLNMAVGFCGGVFGQYLQTECKKQMSSHFVNIKEQTRVNIKIHSQENEQEIEGISPFVSITEQNEMAIFLETNIKPHDTVVFSGSLPFGLPITWYKEMAARLPKNTNVVLDTRGELLYPNLWPYFLVKPNLLELEQMAGKALSKVHDMRQAVKPFFEQGVQFVLVSLGADGAVLFTKNEQMVQRAPKGTAINTIGAGDSMVAGFIAALQWGQSLHQALAYGVACGCATAFSPQIATKKEIEEWLPKVCNVQCKE